MPAATTPTLHWVRNLVARDAPPGAHVSAVPRRAWGLLLFERQRLRTMLPLGDAPITLGRDTACSLVLPQRAVSRLHCSVARRGDAVVVDDASSTNGTYVHGRRVRHAVLHEGDEVCIGTDFVVLADLAHAAWHDDTDLFARLYRDAASGLLNPRGLRVLGAGLASMAHPAMPGWLVLGRVGGADAAADLGRLLPPALSDEAVAGWVGRDEFAVIGVGDVAAARARIRDALDRLATPPCLGSAALPAARPALLRTLHAAARTALFRAAHDRRDVHLDLPHSKEP